MKAAERVVGVRRTLVAALFVTSVAKSAALALGVLLLFGLADLLSPIPLGARAAALPGALAVGLVALAVFLARGRHAFHLTRVALYLEERVPALEYALVTALEAGGPAGDSLEQIVDRNLPDAVLSAPLSRALVVSVALLLVPLFGVAVLPPGIRERILNPVPGDALLASAPVSSSASRLASIVVRVTPPPYARRPEQHFEDPATIIGLTGSRVELRGRGANLDLLDSLGASIAAATLHATAVGDTWAMVFSIPEKPAAMRLTDRGYTRVVALEPVADLAPLATLTAPSRDTTYLRATGRLGLAGSAQDDIGLVRAEFELMHTTGSGERFDIRRITLGGVSPGGARTASLEATLLLDTMKLGPGDVLHVRVVARDGNDVTGPGEGASDTRTIRIADPRARDTIQIVPAAVAALDTTMLSQRMLVIRAETLLVQRRRIAPKAFEERAATLGRHQGELRERVEAVIEELTTATEVGFTGDTQVSLVLGEAAAAMKLAQRELIVFRVKDALPYMYRALKALEKVRNSDRLYLRGVFPKLVVDLDKIRLKGTDQPHVGARDPRPALDNPRAGLLDRLDRALTLLAGRDPGVRDSLILIRVEALTRAPDAAPPLARAIDALGLRRDPVPLIADARRALLRATEAAPAVGGWRGAP